jgi:hypothetical protein
VIELHLTHPAIDLWVDVRLRRIGNAVLAVADLACAPEPAVASRPDLAVSWRFGHAARRGLAG